MSSQLIFNLDDKPKPSVALIAALQHVLASFIGIVTPTLVLGSTLNLQSEVPYLLSMALLVSGLATFIQVKKFGPVGAGIIAVQGTSFAFLGALITAGLAVQAQGGSTKDVLAMLFGLCLFGAFVEIFLSPLLPYLGRIINPVVTGVVILTIGVSLIKVGLTDLAGGYGAPDFGRMDYLLIGLVVVAIVVFLSASRNSWLRLTAIFIGIVSGSLLGYLSGTFQASSLPEANLINLPMPLKYGVDFDWLLFLPIAFIYLLTAIETTGDITAVSHFSGLPVSGPKYLKRVQGGVLADGINSLLAALLSTFPNTTFGQNNAVIQMTGVASRRVGFYIASLLVLLGLTPFVGAFLLLIPKPVLGGATLVMFGTVAVAGATILTREPLDQRKVLIVATSLGAGLGSMQVPTALAQAPEFVQVFLSSPVTVAGLTAILLSLVLPDADPAPDAQKTNCNEKTDISKPS